MSSENTYPSVGYCPPSVHTDATGDSCSSQVDDCTDPLAPEMVPIDADESMAETQIDPAGDAESSWETPLEVSPEETGPCSQSTTVQDRTSEFADSEIASDSEVEILGVVEKPRQVVDRSANEVGGEVRVKQEADGDEGDVLMLGEKTNIKEESQEVEYSWIDMEDEVIEIPDTDEEDLDAQKTPTLGNSLLRNPNIVSRRITLDPTRVRQMQRLYAARALEGRRSIGGANRIFTIPQASTNGHSKSSSDNNESNAWMYTIPQDDDDSRSNFPQIKRLYKAKRKAKKNTLEDDVVFKKAQGAEQARLKGLEAKYRRSLNQVYSDEEEAEESDDGLFMPQVGPRTSSKHTNPIIIDLENEEGPAASEKPGSKRRKTQGPSKRTQAELIREEEANLMAGWEERSMEILKQECDNGDDAKANDGGKDVPKRKSRKRTTKLKGKGNQPNAKYTADLIAGHQPGGRGKKKSMQKLMDSLTTGNVYDAANANLKKAAVPILTGKRKDDAMAQLIAGVPLDESKKAQAITDKNKIIKATRILGKCSVYRKEDHVEGEKTAEQTTMDASQQDGGAWKLKGMTSALFHHQVLGAAKMKEREIGVKEPFGGILADSMGFGKTLMVIAAMIANPPGPDEPHRSTLIVCSPAVISQWDQEIGKHTHDSIFEEIIKHHGYNKLSNKGASGRRAVSKIQKADIVLSTYSELVKSYPKCLIPGDITEEDEQFSWWKKVWDEQRGMLHRAHFYRVVLDEAHAIKNHSCHTSIACRALMAKHRWAVSGTPIHNSVEELYPYFKFLRIPYTSSYKIFRQNFCQSGSKIYNQRLHSYLDHVMIRRTHDDELMGTAIFKLPENHQKTITLEFNRIERAIYEIIKARFIIAINKAVEIGKLEERARLVLMMFQRLRQLTSHVFMLQESMERFMEVEDIELLWNITSSEVAKDSRNANDMKKALQKMLAHKDDTPELGASPESVMLNGKEAKSDDAIVFKFRKYLSALKKSKDWDNLRARSTCSKCGDTADDPWVTSCMHLYCGECLAAASSEAIQNDQDHTACHQCGELFTGSRPCPDLKDLEMSEGQLAEQEASKNGEKKRPHRTAKDNMKWCDMGGNVLPSTKTAAVQIQVETWLSEFPQTKIIVFSQFHLSMLIMGKLIENKGWKYCTYHGKMSHKAREEAVETFGKDPEVKVMIASLKCGGIGLNLTMATRVICIDLWFNSCIEQQAFCRVFRIGQTQETYITRFVIKDTVDEQLIRMQTRKDKVIGAAMDDRTVLSSLSMDELMGLFGKVSYDEKSKPFIYAEEHQELAYLMPDPKDSEEDPVAWQP